MKKIILVAMILSLSACGSDHESAESFYASMHKLKLSLEVGRDYDNKLTINEKLKILDSFKHLPERWVQKSGSTSSTIPNTFPIRLVSEFGTEITLANDKEGYSVKTGIPFSDCALISEAMSIEADGLLLNGEIIPKTENGSAFTKAHEICTQGLNTIILTFKVAKK